MFDEKELLNVFEESDTEFRQNFDNVLASLQNDNIAVYRPQNNALLAISMTLAACFIFAVPAFAVSRIFFSRNDYETVVIQTREIYSNSEDSEDIEITFDE